MGAGVPSGLQNRFEGLEASQVGSIPTYSRHLPINRRSEMDERQQLFAKLPKVDEVLNDEHLADFFENTPRALILEAVKETIEQQRQRIFESGEHISVETSPFFDIIREKIEEKKQASLRRVVNATGVVLHTNLGRAWLSDAACKKLVEIAQGYSNLEYDIKKGMRGSRHSHVEKIITKITGAEAAMVVNNNAAATMLCLSAMAENKEVIVSRGEVVEIGGSFRIPDIMKRSGATLVEVGTTNKTKISDYRAAITGDTAALMKVHTSNYRIVGFTAETTLKELVELGKETGLPVIYDMGSGLISDLSEYGIEEPTVTEGLKTGIDVILFSGDKLLGGPQAGIITGKKSLIDKMKSHPVARIVRVDKLTLAALEETFRSYLDKEKAIREIPVLSMLTIDDEVMLKRGERLAEKLERLEWCTTEIVDLHEKVGGGSAPLSTLEGYGVRIISDVPSHKLERELRKGKNPVIPRIIKDHICFDLRTVSDDEIEIIADEMYAAGKRMQERS